MIHYRDLQGRDLGVADTPENWAAMERATEWARGLGTTGCTYIWREGGCLYFGGPWLGASDYVDHVYKPRGREDPRTSWEEPRPYRWWSRQALDALIDKILRGGQ